MTQTTVTGTGAGTPPPPATPPPAFDAKAMQEQIDELKASLGEKDQAITYLTEKVNAKPAAPAKQEAQTEEDDDTDVLDLLTSKGSKGLEDLLAKRGFVKRDQAETIVNAKATELAKERELMEQYPDLGNKSSEFFKTTAGHYGELVKSGVAPALAMEMAAERTELALIRAGKMKTPQQKKDDEKAQREQDRRARASAQSGDRGTRATAEAEEDEDLTPEQKHIARSMGITEEAYKARAKQGVSMKGVR